MEARKGVIFLHKTALTAKTEGSPTAEGSTKIKRRLTDVGAKARELDTR